MEAPPIPPAETQSSSIWLIVGVIVPILLALFIIVILYWKLCGSEKLEFQPDAINAIQQRQKVSRRARGPLRRGGPADARARVSLSCRLPA